MFSDNKNHFYLKLFSSIEPYVYVFLSPILIFLLTKNIYYSGLFFLVESLFKFFSYAFAGSIVNYYKINQVISYSLTIRFLCTINSLVIFHYFPQYAIGFLMVNGWIYYITNSIYATAFETMFQQRQDFNHKTQVWLSSGESFSGAIATALLSLFAYLKVDFIYLGLVIVPLFISNYLALTRYTSNIGHFHIKNDHHIALNFYRDMMKTYKILKKYKQLRTITFLGFIPLAILIIIEQTNMFKFTELFNVDSMKFIHYVFKLVLFLLVGFVIPYISFKITHYDKYYKISFFCLVVGIVSSLVNYSVYINFVGYILLGFAHYFMLIYRKLKRREIMLENNINFNSLGIFFAIEGLGGAVSFLFLAIFGTNIYALWSFGIIVSYLIFKHLKS